MQLGGLKKASGMKDAHASLLSTSKALFADVIITDKVSYYLQVNTEKRGMIDMLGCSKKAKQCF